MPERKKRLLFYRDYRRFSGGHLKVFDYFNHTKFSDCYVPEIFVTPNSRKDHLWRSEENLAERYDPAQAACLFIAGMDWNVLHPSFGVENKTPVVNFIQAVRHSFPEDPRYAFLARRATRICVSEEVAEAITQTGRCNGPVHTIPNGVDLSNFSAAPMPRDYDVFIAGLKQPSLAIALRKRLQQHGLAVDCVAEPLERAEFLQKIARARIAVTLPHAEEGFFLPALEAMILGCAVICPDCIGNRSFCVDGVTCLTPQADVEALTASVIKLTSDTCYRNVLTANAQKTSERFDIQRERDAFLEILHAI